MTNYTDYCGACRYFADEDVTGRGWCELRGEPANCSESCRQGKRRVTAKCPLIAGRIVSDKTFALRLRAFVEEVQPCDAMSEEERDYLLGVANRLLAYQAQTATDPKEIDYLERNGIKP